MPRLLVAAVLLLAAVLPTARGDLVSTASYTCDPSTCLPPACLCAANNPPGGLTSAQMPQFILLSHDNALNANAFNLSQELYASIKQRNNCPVPLTWFAMRYHSSCTSGKAAIARGDELAMQANRFYPTDPFTSTDPNPNYDSRDPVTGKPSVEIEITMSRQWWHDTCGIPLRNMVGYRSQGYYNNAPIRQTLKKHGYLYDSTLIERWYTWNPTSPSADAMLMPYTMDAGIPQECNFLGDTIGSCTSSEKYPGLWEVPLWELQEGDVLYGVSNYGDTKTPGVPAISDLYTLLKSQLDARLAGGRAPMQISQFYEWLSVKPANPPADDPSCLTCYRAPSANALALVKFIKYAVQQPDVWFVTYSDLIRWMQSPVPKDQFADWWGAGCTVPGVKADLSAVNLSAAEKAEGAPVLASSPSPSPNPSPAQTSSPSASPVASPVTSPSTAPSPSPSPASPAPATPPTGNGAVDALAPSPAPAGTTTITNSSRLARLPGALVAALLGMLSLLLAL